MNEEIYKMKFTKTLFALAIGSVGIAGAMSASAATLNNGDVLTIQASTVDGSGYVVLGTGSYFGMDSNKNGVIAKPERVALAQGTTGLTIGKASTTPGDITSTWLFFGNPGTDYLTSAVTGGTATGLNMSGWTVTWNGIPTIPMGSGAWGTGYTSGLANFSWDGNYGSTYTLDYHATVPVGDVSGFGGVQYALHLQGTVQAAPVPEASTYGMMLAGLGLVGFAVRRRKLV